MRGILPKQAWSWLYLNPASESDLTTAGGLGPVSDAGIYRHADHDGRFRSASVPMPMTNHDARAVSMS